MVKEVTSLGDNLIFNEMGKAKQVIPNRNAHTCTWTCICLNTKINHMDFKNKFKETKEEVIM